MRVLVSLCLIPAIICAVNAQPIIDVTCVGSMMDGGVREYFAENADGLEFPHIEEGSTDNEFHFESLAYRPSSEALKYKSVDGVPYNELFPDAQYSNLVTEGEGLHTFFVFRDDTLFNLGNAGIVQGAVMVADYTPDWKWYVFPLRLGESWSWSQPKIITVPEWDLSEESTCETRVIASGTIHLPDGMKKCLVVRRYLISTLRIPGTEVIVEALDFEFVCTDGTVAIATIREEDINRNEKRLSNFRYEKIEGTGVPDPTVAGDNLHLHPAFPNPAVRGRASLSWNAGYGDYVRLTLHDSRGLLLQELYADRSESGLQWLELNLNGRPRGTYFIRLTGEKGMRVVPVIHSPK